MDILYIDVYCCTYLLEKMSHHHVSLPFEPVNMLDAVSGAPGLLLPEKKNMILCYWNLVLIQVVCI